MKAGLDLEIGMFRCLVATEEERLGLKPGDLHAACTRCDNIDIGLKPGDFHAVPGTMYHVPCCTWCDNIDIIAVAATETK